MFTWRYLDESEGVVGTSEPFEDQGAAEAWLGQEWERLRQRGVEQVVLFEEEESVYRMGLGPEPG